MIQNAASATKTTCISCHIESNTFCLNEMEGDFLWVVCENICHYRPSAAEKRIKNKMPNLDWNAINIGAKCWNWLEDYTMHKTLNACLDIISCHIRFVCLFKILKQKNNSQRKNSVFCFSWKVEKMQIQHFVLWPTKCRTWWPIFRCQMTLSHILKAVCGTLENWISTCDNLWPHNNCRSWWPIFHGSMI